MYCTLTPFNRVEDPKLNIALAVLGAEAPTRRALAGQLLDKAYNNARSVCFYDIHEYSHVCITLDGWKKRNCEQGAPLITVCVLLPNGKSVFYKVCYHLTLLYSILLFWLMLEHVVTYCVHVSSK